MPKNITKEGEKFIQTQFGINSPNMCLFNLDIGQWMAKLRIQLMTFPVGSKLTVGLIRKDEFNKADNIFKDTLNCMYIDSTGKSKNTQHNHIGLMQVNNSIDFFVKKNNFRIVCKNNNSIMNLADKNYYFFFALEGNCQITVTYPFNK